VKEIATLARAANLRLVPAAWGGAPIVAASLHIMASLPASPHTENVPYPRMLEFDVGDNPLRDRLITRPFRPEGGFLVLPTGPGLGIELDPAVVEAFRAKL
jgi:D-galactarolactone cycloisomerase